MDNYDILGVTREATQPDIKKAYRALAREFHPDRNPDSEAAERFKAVVEAYEVLRDESRRAEYDASVARRTSAEGIMGSFEDLFSVFSDRSRDRPRRGGNIIAEVMIDLRDILTGANREVEIARNFVCTACSGTGASAGIAYHACPKCRGWGEINYRTATGSGIATRTEDCGACKGTGRVIDDPCETCDGDGIREFTVKMPVDVPSGVEPDEVLRFPGNGHEGFNGGENGDLLVVVRVHEDVEFEREGRDIVQDAHVTFTQAALGDSITVLTLEGEVEVKVLPGTQTGTVITVPKRGIPTRDGQRGDLRVRVVVDTPTRITPQARRLLLELAEGSGEDTSRMGKGKGGARFSFGR
ncbi:DnaJ domain-containing protein [Candidatus Uhrbacteria bacterium]|nr:DnaJ domain-containing protein [Candidatus Uhrbacteria bacterium]